MGNFRNLGCFQCVEMTTGVVQMFRQDQLTKKKKDTADTSPPQFHLLKHCFDRSCWTGLGQEQRRYLANERRWKGVLEVLWQQGKPGQGISISILTGLHALGDEIEV